MMLRIARAFVARWFVQQQVNPGAKPPDLAVDDCTAGPAVAKSCPAASSDAWRHDPAGPDQRAALFAAKAPEIALLPDGRVE